LEGLVADPGAPEAVRRRMVGGVGSAGESRALGERLAAEVRVAGPLAGRRILVTRAAAQAEALAGRLTALGADAVACPAIETRPTPPAELCAALAAAG